MRHPAAYSAQAAYNPRPEAVTDAGDAAVSRARSAQTFRTRNEHDQARYPVLQWLCGSGVLGDAAKKTGAEIERWRQGSAAAAARLAEARAHHTRLANSSNAVAAALGRAGPTAEGLAAARQAVVDAEDVCVEFRVSPTVVELQGSWMRLWNSPDSVWVAALDALEHTKGPEADRARSWLTFHLTRDSDRRGELARSGGNWIVAGLAG
jgi:hypothetical protein